MEPITKLSELGNEGQVHACGQQKPKEKSFILYSINSLASVLSLIFSLLSIKHNTDHHCHPVLSDQLLLLATQWRKRRDFPLQLGTHYSHALQS